MDDIYALEFQSGYSTEYDDYDFERIYIGLENAKKAAQEYIKNDDEYTILIHPTHIDDDGWIDVDYDTDIAKYDPKLDDDDDE